MYSFIGNTSFLLLNYNKRGGSKQLIKVPYREDKVTPKRSYVFPDLAEDYFVREPFFVEFQQTKDLINGTTNYVRQL